MKVVNKHSATLTVGRARIAPDADADLSAEAVKGAGVQAWLKSGKLAEVKDDADAKKPAKTASKD